MKHSPTSRRRHARARLVLPVQRRMTLAVVIVAVTLLSLAALVIPSDADAAASQTVTSATSRGWVTGVVVNRHGDPVEGALVNALNPREVPEAGVVPDVTDRRDHTDAHGRFRVRQAAPGYLLQICQVDPTRDFSCLETMQGVRYLITYAGPTGVTDSWVTQTSLFEPTATNNNVGTITVKPQSFVHGRLAHAAFQPVQLQRLNGTTAFHGQTDAKGNYRFPGLAPGHYRVAAGGNGTGFLPYQSAVINLAPRKDAEQNGILRPGASIHGVLTSHGRPVPFTDLLVSRPGAGFVAGVTTDDAGRFDVAGLEPDTYTVGILYDGSQYQRKAVKVVVPDTHSSVQTSLAVRKGASITISFRNNGRPAARARDELRDSAGRPVLGLQNGGGQATYTGLAPGTYTVVAVTGDRFSRKTVTVKRGQAYDAGVLRIAKPTLTLTGTTAPNAVVEAFSGNLCPPDGAFRNGAFHQIEKADGAGHYTITGLVPGRYMLGSDGWPANIAPRCVPNVSITADRSYDLPLETGAQVHGRLVYAATGTPVITTLSYELSYPAGSWRNPTGEHPARSQTVKNTGEFSIIGLPAGTVDAALAQTADLEQINSPRYFVIYPTQDGTPYYLTSVHDSLQLGAGEERDLGDIEVTLHR